MKLSIAIHLIGFTLWVGSLLILPTFLKGIKVGVDSGALIVESVRKVYYGIFLPGMFMTLFTGILQFILGGGVLYFKQGWFHSKVLFLLILFSATYFLFIEVEKVGKGGVVNLSRVKLVQVLTGIALLGIILSTMLLRNV